MTHPVCPRCDALAPTPDALTCPTCSYWPLRVPTESERLDRRLETQPIHVTTNRDAA